MGSSMPLSTDLVLPESVNNPFSARSTLAPRNTCKENMLIATKNIASRTRPAIDTILRSRFAPIIGASFPLLRFLQVDENDVGKQENTDDRGEEGEISKIDQPLRDRIEMREEAE